MSPVEICSTYDAWGILARRWAATWMDFILFGVVGFALSLLGEKQQGLAIALGATLFVLYYPLLEGLTGRTFGKLLCGLRVVNAEGGRPGLAKATVRTLLRLVDINPLLAGALPAAISVYCSRTRQRLGDSAAKTYVVKSEDLPLLNPPAPGAAINEFALPGVVPAPPVAPGPAVAYVAPGASYTPPGRVLRPAPLPTRNPTWPIPGAVVATGVTIALGVACAQATAAEKRVRPVTMTCANFLAAPPKKGWFQLTGCSYSIGEVVYDTSPVDPYASEATTETTEATSETKETTPEKTKVGDIYLTVFSTAEHGGQKTPLLVQTEDAKVRKLVEQGHALEGAGDEKINAWVKEHAGEFEVQRTIQGTVEDDFKLPESIRKAALEDGEPQLREPYVVLKEGQEPFGWASFATFMGACLAGFLALVYWALAFATVVGGSAPRSAIPMQR